MAPTTRVWIWVTAGGLIVGSIDGSIGAQSLAVARAAAVSPGEQSAVEVESRCPTFHWAGVAGARQYELVVYELAEEGVSDGARDPRVVLQKRLPAGVQGWTPSLGDCLERGSAYAWAVRAERGAGQPIVPLEVLAAHTEGLTALLGPTSEPVRALTAGRPDRAAELLAPWRTWFGPHLRLEAVAQGDAHRDRDPPHL